MTHRIPTSFAAVAVLVVSAATAAPNPDLRVRYGTQNLAAAKLILKSMELQDQGKWPAALEAVDAALRLDPACGFALFQRAIALGQLGRIQEAIASYRACLDAEPSEDRVSATRLHAAINLGLTLSKIDRRREAQRYFTEAILDDPADRMGLQSKAFRNMGICLLHERRPLAAAMAVAMARQADPENVSQDMLTHFRRQIGDDEAGQLLTVGDLPDTPAAPEDATALSEVPPDDLGGASLLAAVAAAGGYTQLLPDPQGRYVLGLFKTAAEPAYHVIATGQKLSVTSHRLPGKVTCAELVGGKLYVIVVDEGLSLYVMDAAAGRRRHKIKLTGMAIAPPGSMAVFPQTNRVYLPTGRGDKLCGLKMTTGELFITDVPGHWVCADPQRRLLFSYLRPPAARPPAPVRVVNGRPVVPRVPMDPRRIDWRQSTMYITRVCRRTLLKAGVRLKAAANAQRIVCSPDGKWVAPIGLGGWRPRRTYEGVKPGYGVPVFAAVDIEHLRGFFPSGRLPRMAAFNPVTGQLVTVAAGEARISHLADSTASETLTGKFTAVAFGGSGGYLLLGDATRGLRAYRIELTAAQQKLSATWWREVVAAQAAETPQAALEPAVAFKADPRMATFQVRSKREDLVEALARAMKANRTDAPPDYRNAPRYIKNLEATRLVNTIVDAIDTESDIGIAIYKLRAAQKTHPNFAPLQYELANLLVVTGQLDDGVQMHLAAIHNDAGRTDLTCMALMDLHRALKDTGDSLGATYCLAESLALDAANPRTLRSIIPLLKRSGFKTEADKLLDVMEDHGEPTTGPNSLPVLATPGAATEALSPEEIYRRSVRSIVLVRQGKNVGTAFAVAPDVLVTNAHVVSGSGLVKVWPFEYTDGKLVRREVRLVKIVYSFPRRDIALLWLRPSTEPIASLLLSDKKPRTGQRVFAIGNPGLGSKVLTQSISNGIVSSTDRTLKGRTYLQHTAAINPGNSGGPLLDEFGRVIGMITLKADLENVSFAIPAAGIRHLFPKVGLEKSAPAQEPPAATQPALP